MKDGYMQQVDSPINLYNFPNNQFVAGFIGSPQMNFYDGKITKEGAKVFVEFDNYKAELPKSKIDLIVNGDLYYNTGKSVIFGIRPEDMYDNAEIVANPKAVTIDVSVDVVERLGAESLLYCKTAGHKANVLTADSESLNVDEDAPNLIAKVDARSTSNVGDKIKLALDMTRCQIFDATSELTIVARDKESKAKIEALHQEHLKVEAYAEEVAAQKAAEEAAAAEAAALEEAKKNA
jgi:multiple sugar transport system ATP-binding protein